MLSEASFSRIAGVILLVLISISSVHAGYIQHTIANNFTDACSIYGVDLDDDGDIDIFAGGLRSGVSAWFENDGTQHFTQHILNGEFGPRMVMVADIDGDDDPDPIAASYHDNGIKWWENEGSGEFSEHEVAAVLTGAHTLDVCDFDGDTDMDVLCASWDSGYLWYENDGSQNFTEHLIAGEGSGASSVRGIDINQDGQLDLVGSCYTLGSVLWWEADGTSHTVDSNISGAHWVDGADFDGDGDVDLVCAAYNISTVRLYLNDGEENFSASPIYSVGGASWLQAVDMDGDSDVDILVTAEIADKIIWLENNGSAEFTAHEVAPGFDKVFGAHAIDLNEDGYMDVLGAAVDANRLAWWEDDSNIPHALETTVAPGFAEPDEDEVTVSVAVHNPSDHELAVNASIHSLDASVSYVSTVFDDGDHEDGEEGDNLFAGQHIAPGHEDIYAVDVFVVDNETGTSHMVTDAAFFTTIGPLTLTQMVYADTTDTIPNPGDVMRIRLQLTNEGGSATATELRGELTILDSLATFWDYTTSFFCNYPDISVGETVISSGLYTVRIDEQFPADTDLHFRLAVHSDGHAFWEDSLSFHVYSVNDLDPDNTVFPTEFKLVPPHPNPFNSTIRFAVELPLQTGLDIRLFNALGREVAVLTQERVGPGRHEFSYRPDGFGSGTYFLRVQASGYEESVCRVVYLK